MRVLVVGSGGREHALCWAIAQSPRLTKLYCAPGNAGIAALAECIDIAAEDVDSLVAFATHSELDLVVVGPEGPLVKGLVDRLTEARIAAFGPSAKAAMLEGSKGFMKDLCAKYAIPSADYDRFDEPDAAKEYIRKIGAPVVVKADGLAAGKGVAVCHTVNEAFAAIDHIMTERAFGDAGEQVVIEEFMTGEEVSFFALADGRRAIPLIEAQDHKAVGEGDTGPNTGGMGAYSPAATLTEALKAEVMERIIDPTVRGMAAEGRPFTGVLFAGLMITATGPRLLEFNVRFGDPECQVLMTRWKSDVLEALAAAAAGRLDAVKLDWHDEAALCVVMAAKGYPGKYEKDTAIDQLDVAGAVEGVTVFHAGTKRAGKRILANGGRVLGVTARAKTVAEAQKRAYRAVDLVRWPEGFCRRDIGWRALKRG